jgi:tetratricopeptide (TPR) repeat protein
MALRINPNFSAAVSNLGLIHLWIGDPVNALPLIKKASILSPEQTIHNFHLASLYDALGIDPLAERYYRKTIALDETSSFAYRALAQLLIVTGRTSEARGMLAAALRRQEDDPYLLLGAGEVELFDGKPEKAEGYYRKAADVLGGNFKPTTQLGFILLQTGRETEGRNLLRESLAITEEALADGSENYDHSLDRARVFAIQQDTTAALHWLGKAIDAGWMLERILAMDPQLQSLKGNRLFAEQLAQLRARNSEARRRLTETGMLN